MAEEDPILSELASKKKKKKKKLPFELDSLDGGGAEGSTGSGGEVQQGDGTADTATGRSDKENKEPDSKADDDSGLDLELSGKKKRKKKVIFDMNKIDAALPEVKPKEDSGMEGNVGLEEGQPEKKKKKKDLEEELEGGKENVGGAEENENVEVSNKALWIGSDRDYTYDELLTRVFNIMQEKNPDMVAGKKQKFVMRPPHVVRIGTKKTSFANFTEVCKNLHRQPKHLLDYLLAELGTNGSVDGNSQLIIKGRFQQKQIESVLRRYIKDYVMCKTCRSPDTILQKDTRLFFLQCETCGSRCSVASIKSGFQAVTGKRAAIRAKTT
ncbi:hypothetical protein B566_EDAN004349 [Ephemera danica]|nr:hypothetical protein B566_EDAN004349 [Ephemera danica]